MVALFLKNWSKSRPSRAGLAALALIAAALLPFVGHSLVAQASDSPRPATSGSPTPSGARSQLPAPLTGKQEPSPGSDDAGPFMSPKQRQELLKANFEKMKRDADDLASMAKSLQQDLGKSSENVLSLKVLDRAEKIEKLARKIKSEATKGD